MRRYFGLLLALFILQTAGSRADAPPHLDFVRGLRNEGLTDLALEYLEKLRAAPPADIADQVPLEYARTVLEAAAVELDQSKRATMLSNARTEFDNYLKKNKDHPEANLELARLQSMLGRAQLNKAKRGEDAKAKASEGDKARPLFEDAAKRFDNSGKLISAELKKMKGDTGAAARFRQLTDAQSRAQLEEAINRYYIAESYLGGDEKQALAKANTIRKARQDFNRIYESGEQVDRYGWIAAAWSGYLSALLDLPNDAKKYFDELLVKNTNNPVAYEGVRIGKYFKSQLMLTGKEDIKGDEKVRYETAGNMAGQWLKDYAAYRNTPEGLGSRFTLGVTQQFLGERDLKRDKDGKASISGVGARYLSDADKAFKELTDYDNEYTERALRRRQTILIELADAQDKGEATVASITSLERGMLQAQVQEARLILALRKLEDTTSEEAQKTVRKLEGERLGKAIAYLERGLQSVSTKDLPRDVFDARYLLTRYYLFGGQPMTAAVYGESLAKNNLRLPKAAAACSLAVQGYNRMASQAIAGGDDTAYLADADIARLKKLAAYMDATWPNDAATDEARHMWAYYEVRAKNHEAALNVFSKIKPTYNGIYEARLSQGGALFALCRGDVPENRIAEHAAAQIKKYGKQWNETLNALKGLPDPGSGGSLADSQKYCLAKLQLCQLLQLQEKYKEIEGIAVAVEKALPELGGFQNSPAEKEEILYRVKNMHLVGVQGQASKLLQDGKYAQVADVLKAPLAAVVKEIGEDAKKPALKDVRTYAAYDRMRQRILIIALRTAIQDNKLDQATELLGTLEKSGGTVESRTENLRQLVETVRTQYTALGTASKTQEQAKLAEGFSKFLELFGQGKLPPALQSALAKGYAAIDQPAKAVDLMEKMLKELPMPPKGKENDFSDSATKNYRIVQMELARAYRAAKQFEKADKYIEGLIGTAQAKGPFYGSLIFRKEKAYLLEDQGKYRDAVTLWTYLAKMFGEPLPKPNPEQEADVRKRATYFDLFVESARCSAKAYQSLDVTKNPKNADVKTEGFGKVAQRLFDMETKNPDLSLELKDKVRELLEEYKPVKDKYKALGGKFLEGN